MQILFSIIQQQRKCYETEQAELLEFREKKHVFDKKLSSTQHKLEKHKLANQQLKKSNDDLQKIIIKSI